MGWKHIVIEGHCLFDDTYEIPLFCKYGPGKVGIHCVKASNNSNEYCSYLGIGSSRASIVLTDSNGDLCGYSSFWTDEDISGDKWIEEEKVWLKRWIRHLDFKDKE